MAAQETGSYQIAHRIAERAEPRVAAAFRKRVRLAQSDINLDELANRIARGEHASVLVTLIPHRNFAVQQLSPDPPKSFFEELEKLLYGVIVGVDAASTEAIADALDVELTPPTANPDAELFAWQQGARLVRDISDDVAAGIQIIVAAGIAHGITPAEQARLIRGMIGLPRNWADAPLHLGVELRAGRFNRARRLPEADKAAILDRLERGTVSEAFIARMQERYSRSLLERRALNIARTETMRAANHGLRTSWRRAAALGILPGEVKRVVVVVRDERLRATHRQCAEMNALGVSLYEDFMTPWGPLPGPPWDPDPWNCRCSEALILPGQAGVL